MAGFIDNQTMKNSSVIQKIRSSIIKISSMGMNYSDMVVKNSQAIGVTEDQYLNSGNALTPETLYALGNQDIKSREYICYFDHDYKGKREYLRKFSMNPEVEYVLDQISDDAIVNDDMNFFAYPSFLNLSDISDEIKESINDEYKRIYSVFGFNNDGTAWSFFRKLLVEGFLSFEIIYDDQGKEIIGFKELDPTSLVPSVIPNPDGTYTDCWIQYMDDPSRKRVLLVPQIIYMSYSRGNYIGRLSYVERLIRPFNILRIIEQSRVIWTVMNSSFKMKMTVPIGTSSPQKANQTLGELLTMYKEDVTINEDSGELLFDGNPKVQFYKNYLIPKGINGEPTIEGINQDGPNLNDTKPLAYFFDKFKQESKVPFSRFGGPEGAGSGTFSSGAEGMDKEEIRFSKFIERMRSLFQDILIKPLWYQISIKHPELNEDYLLKSQLGLKFVSDNYYSRILTIELMNKKKTFIEKLKDLKDSDGKNYFSPTFLAERYLGLSGDDIMTNRKFKEKRKNKKVDKNNTSEEGFKL